MKRDRIGDVALMCHRTADANVCVAAASIDKNAIRHFKFPCSKLLKCQKCG